jgi:alpha-D-ribose 1-methylphosphonate 5-triphosphate synthase subunit PhnH
MDSPLQSAAEERAHQTFTALMWALSQPGQTQPLPASGLAAFATIAEALVDLETSYCTNDADLQRMLASTGARARSPSVAMYQFYPMLTVADVPVLVDTPCGTYSYPDESATLVIGCALGIGRRLRLHGPGIAGVIELLVGHIPHTFWPLREQVCRYPLGWDILLVAHDRVVGLPRTTQIEVA